LASPINKIILVVPPKYRGRPEGQRDSAACGKPWTLPAIVTVTDYRVDIPKEHYQILNFRQDDLPGVAVINSALKTFEPKIVFRWHLSIMLDFEDLIDNRMPSKREREIIDEYENLLDKEVKGPDKTKPNALFLARITWNKTHELIWRVYDAERVHKYLQQIISNGSSPRPFDYRIDPDDKWKLAEWHLKDWT
jgi:hypothetical protein